MKRNKINKVKFEQGFNLITNKKKSGKRIVIYIICYP